MAPLAAAAEHVPSEGESCFAYQALSPPSLASASVAVVLAMSLAVSAGAGIAYSTPNMTTRVRRVHVEPPSCVCRVSLAMPKPLSAGDAVSLFVPERCQ